MAIRVKRTGSKSPVRTAKLRKALKQGRSAEAENVLSARKRRIDAKLRDLRVSLQGGPVHVVAATGGVRLRRSSDQRSSQGPSSQDQETRFDFSSRSFAPAE